MKEQTHVHGHKSIYVRPVIELFSMHTASLTLGNK